MPRRRLFGSPESTFTVAEVRDHKAKPKERNDLCIFFGLILCCAALAIGAIIGLIFLRTGQTPGASTSAGTVSCNATTLYEYVPPLHLASSEPTCPEASLGGYLITTCCYANGACANPNTQLVCLPVPGEIRTPTPVVFSVCDS